MKYDDPVKPISQDLDKGLLVRILKMENVDDLTNKLEPYGVSPMTGRPLVGKNVATEMGFEGGSGISVTNATQYYGKKGTLLRRKLRIDKCPWPNGQTNIRVRFTVTYGQTIGNNGATASPAVRVEKWFRNDHPFEFILESNVASATDFQKSLGFNDASASLRVRLESRGVGPGHPLVKDDENGLSETFMSCYIDNPSFTQGLSFLDGIDHHELFLPCPIWVKHRLSFSEGFIGTKYNGGPLGIVMGIVVTVEAVGWDTGYHDLEGWHAESGGDNYQIPKPNTYEYPNYPIEDPFNPTGEGVG